MISILVNRCKFSKKKENVKESTKTKLTHPITFEISSKRVNNDVIHPRANLCINMRHLPYKTNNHSSENKKQTLLVILHSKHTFQRNTFL